MIPSWDIPSGYHHSRRRDDDFHHEGSIGINIHQRGALDDCRGGKSTRTMMRRARLEYSTWLVLIASVLAVCVEAGGPSRCCTASPAMMLRLRGGGRTTTAQSLSSGSHGGGGCLPLKALLNAMLDKARIFRAPPQDAGGPELASEYPPHLNPKGMRSHTTPTDAERRVGLPPMPAPTTVPKLYGKRQNWAGLIIKGDNLHPEVGPPSVPSLRGVHLLSSSQLSSTP